MSWSCRVRAGPRTSTRPNFQACWHGSRNSSYWVQHRWYNEYYLPTWRWLCYELGSALGRGHLPESLLGRDLCRTIRRQWRNTLKQDTERLTALMLQRLSTVWEYFIMRGRLSGGNVSWSKQFSWWNWRFHLPMRTWSHWLQLQSGDRDFLLFIRFQVLIKCKISMTRSPSSTFKMTHLVATLVPIFSIFIIALIIRYTCCRRDEYSRTLLFEEDDNEIDDETKVPKSVSQSKTTAPLKTNYTEVS